jgi:hypothetical protein
MFLQTNAFRFLLCLILPFLMQGTGSAAPVTSVAGTINGFVMHSILPSSGVENVDIGAAHTTSSTPDNTQTGLTTLLDTPGIFSVTGKTIFGVQSIVIDSDSFIVPFVAQAYDVAAFPIIIEQSMADTVFDTFEVRALVLLPSFFPCSLVPLCNHLIIQGILSSETQSIFDSLRFFRIDLDADPSVNLVDVINNLGDAASAAMGTFVLSSSPDIFLEIMVTPEPSSAILMLLPLAGVLCAWRCRAKAR